MRSIARILYPVIAAAFLSVSTTTGVAAATDDCGTTTASLDICLSKAMDVASAKLTAAYNDVQARAKKTDEGLAAQLSQSQETWKLYLKQTCDGVVWSYWDPGTIKNSASIACKIALTREPIGDLDNMLRAQWIHP